MCCHVLIPFLKPKEISVGEKNNLFFCLPATIFYQVVSECCTRKQAVGNNGLERREALKGTKIHANTALSRGNLRLDTSLIQPVLNSVAHTCKSPSLNCYCKKHLKAYETNIAQEVTVGLKLVAWGYDQYEFQTIPGYFSFPPWT